VERATTTGSAADFLPQQLALPALQKALVDHLRVVGGVLAG